MKRRDYEQGIRVKEELIDINLTLREICLYLSVFNPNARKYGPEKLRIRTLHAVLHIYIVLKIIKCFLMRASVPNTRISGQNLKSFGN